MPMVVSLDHYFTNLILNVTEMFEQIGCWLIVNIDDTNGIRLYYCGVNVYCALKRAANCDCGGWGGLRASHTNSHKMSNKHLKTSFKSTELRYLL